jgi:hypothetical protein
MNERPELEPVEETTEETTKELHVEGDTVVVETTPEGGQTITATDDPAPDDEEPQP